MHSNISVTISAYSHWKGDKLEAIIKGVPYWFGLKAKELSHGSFLLASQQVE